jgi:DNA-binding response OmpR family regulator
MVLVVDDEAPVRGIIQRTLTQHGYRVAIASEGADAMKQFQQYGKEISIVLTDMMMPGMDGKNLVRTLRETAPQLPIVAMTGLSDKESLDHLEALSVPVLQKPFLPDQLLAMLHRALRR